MGSCEDILENFRADIKRLEQEIAVAREELIQGFNSRKRKTMSSGLVLRLLSKENEINLKKRLCQALDLRAFTEESRKKDEKERLSDLRFEIYLDLGEYARGFHSHVARKMKLPWPYLASALRKERSRLRDGAWREEKYHVELFEHLKYLGFTKEMWNCSLEYAPADGYDNFPASPEDINAQIRKDREFLNSEEVRQILSPAALEMFTKLIEQYELRIS